MSDPSESECNDCAEEYDHQCERCGYFFCLEHATKHTVEECDRFRADTRRDLHVFHTGDSNEYWIATDGQDVRVQQEEAHGCPDEIEDIHQLADDYLLKIGDEDAPDVTEDHTCAEWVLQEGRGLLCACEP